MGIDSSLFPDLHLERSSLKDQTVDLLRNLIVSGRIAAGTKITERDVAEMLNISRMPARDALMDLERQGLVVTKPGGRYVIQLDESAIRHLYEVRLALEKLGLELAILNYSPQNLSALQDRLSEMRNAIMRGDADAYTDSDLELHALIWRQSDNVYLQEMLLSMIGPIFMFIASQARMAEDWQESFALHEQMVASIANKDVSAAIKTIEAHNQHSLSLALQNFH